MIRLKITICILLIFSSHAFGQKKRIDSFTELYNNLIQGENVSVIIEYGKAILISDSGITKSIDAIGGMSLLPFEFFPKGSIRNEKAFISSSTTTLISHYRYGTVYNYVKIRLYEDDTVEIIVNYFDSVTFAIKMKEMFRAQINSTNNGGAVSLFK